MAALAALLQWVVHPLVGSHVPFLFFLPVLVYVASALGRGPALVVLLVGAANASLLAQPVGHFAVENPQDVASLLLYLGVGGFLVFYGGYLRLKTRRAALAEQRLALAQDRTGIGVFELDFLAQTAYVSPSLRHMLGQPDMARPMSLDAWLTALHPEPVADARQAMQERLTRGEFRYEREQRIPLPDGEVVWLLNRIQLEASDAGVLTHARGAAVDITRRKQVDDLLRATQAELQRQVEDLERLHGFSQKLVAVGDGLPGALQGLLELLVDLYGTAHGVVSLVDVDRGLHVAAQTGFAGPVSVSSAGSAGLTHEDILGAHHVLLEQHGLRAMHGLPLTSASGEVMGAICVMFAEPHAQSAREARLCEVCATTAAAVVERERARVRAARTEQRFAVALESSVVPFSILSPVRSDDGRIVDFEWSYLNPAAARALGGDAAKFLGRRVGKTMPYAWDAPGQFEQYVRLVENAEPCEFEVRSAASNQGGRWYRVIASPLQGSAAVWFADISERKRHEHALEAADQRKDEFLATLAHELRNPLGAIRQGVRIARNITSSDAQKRWGHAVIERQVHHMSLLLDDLLDVARIGQGTLLLRKSREVLSEVIDTAVETARPHIEAKRHLMELDTPPQPILVEVDPLRIAQVIGNLLINAAKYTDPGGRIRLRVEREADAVAIRIKDNGIGLTQEQMGQVFEMFSQIPASLEKSQGGLGIGLALARGLVELHDGTIEVSSAGPGRGAEFCVRLPNSCGESSRPPVDPTALVTSEMTRDRAHSRILIADDNRDAADSLAELLRLDGHEVHVAYDGEEALAAFFRIAPDAALLDVGMPRLSGLEVVRAIREHSHGRRATLIAVTGWGEEKDRHGALAAGFDHHITKPMDPERIQALIESGRLARLESQ